MKQIITLYLMVGLWACQAQEKVSEASPPSSKYLRWVGDIAVDERLDKASFQTCNGENVAQYFNFSNGLEYKGEKKALSQIFQEKYTPISDDSQTGLIRIRFIVNCKGKTGRFRLIASDENYQSKEFDKAITDQLMAITQSLDGWSLQPDAENPQDYYQYLIFKIEQGNITEILP